MRGNFQFSIARSEIRPLQWPPVSPVGPANPKGAGGPSQIQNLEI